MKNGVFGIKSFSFADCVENAGYPSKFENSIKAIVSGSLSFNDQAAQTTDVDIEDSEDPYAVLTSSAAQKGFVIQTYDLSEDNYVKLLGYKKTNVGSDSATKTAWINEAPKESEIYKAIQIITEDLDEIPSRIFQWSKMKLTVTRSGSIGKTGLPNLNIECRQMAVFDSSNEKASGHRWVFAKDAKSDVTDVSVADKK